MSIGDRELPPGDRTEEPEPTVGPSAQELLRQIAEDKRPALPAEPASVYTPERWCNQHEEPYEERLEKLWNGRKPGEEG